MKLKYLLRGMGIGILFTALLFIAFRPAGGEQQMTDEEIMERAAELGMFTEDEAKDKIMDEKLDKLQSQSPSPLPDTTPSPAINASPEITPSPAITASPVPTSSPTPEKTASPKPAEPTKSPEMQEEKVTLTITAGMSSESVAAQLKDAGVIKDASDFNAYLADNGYATKLRIGTYSIPKNSSYRAIVDVIT